MHIPSQFWSIEKLGIKLTQISIDFKHERCCLVTLTGPKVNSGVETLNWATLEVASPSSISGEKHHLVTKVRPEQLGQVTQVVVVTGKVTAIFVLHLRAKRAGGASYFPVEWRVMLQEKLQFYLHSDDRATILVQIRFNHGQYFAHPLVHCWDII